MRDDNFTNDLNRMVGEGAKKKAKQEALLLIAERLKGHDFCGEILDDRWVDNVTQEAIRYLNDDETKSLGDLAEPEEDPEDLVVAQHVMVAEGEHLVLREFVMYLCRLYDVGPGDLSDRLDEHWAQV